MKVYYEPEIKFEDCLEQIVQHTPPIAEQKCPHCGLVARYPVVMRDSDRRMFEELMAAAQAVLNRNGVTAHLLSELHAQITVSKAKRR
jgi:hypothetical protein